MKPYTDVNVLGVNIAPVTVTDLHQFIKERIAANDHALVLNVNVQCLNLAYTDPDLQQFLNQGDLVFCDGAGVILGARILGKQIPERITYADWMWQLADFASTHGYSFYFLGSEPGVAAQASDNLQAKFPTLDIRGSHHGYFDKTTGDPENLAVIADINACQPDILVLGMGMPLQEYWLKDNWDQIDARVALTGGAVFDYVSGTLQRGPRWMNDNGFEWLARLVIEPKRLWKRYIIGNPLFLWRLYKQWRKNRSYR